MCFCPEEEPICPADLFAGAIGDFGEGKARVCERKRRFEGFLKGRKLGEEEFLSEGKANRSYVNIKGHCDSLFRAFRAPGIASAMGYMGPVSLHMSQLSNPCNFLS